MNFLKRISARKASATFTQDALDLLGSDDFRAIAYIREDGTWLVAKGQRYEPVFTRELETLTANGKAPRPLRGDASIQTVALAEISRLRGESGHDLNRILSDETVTTGGKLLLQAIRDAAEARASDVKIFCNGDQTLVRFRVAGSEFNYGEPWTVDQGRAALEMAFNARDGGGGHATKIARAFQSFSIAPRPDFALPGNVIKLRGQRGPHEDGAAECEHMVLRFFYNDLGNGSSELPSLGFDEQTLDVFAADRRSLSGAVIIGGITGDGKSTTLVALLRAIYRAYEGKLSIATVEDPVEYSIEGDGIIQIPISSSGSLEERTKAFAQALSHFVRINPDIGMISEIRDIASARQALQFVDSGHKVYTTIHTETANGIPFRLMDLGVQPSEICKPGSIGLLVKQSLISVLCPHCALTPDTKGVIIPLELTRAGHDYQNIRFRNPEGCKHCIQTDANQVAKQAWRGYMRQQAVAEMIKPDETYLRHVQRREPFDAYNYWLSPEGLHGETISMKLSALALAGIVDPNDVVHKGAKFDARQTISINRPRSVK